jgi:hypothetical protein
MQTIGLGVVFALGGSACTFEVADKIEELVEKVRLNVDETQMAELLDLTSRAGRKIGAGLGSIDAMPERPEEGPSGPETTLAPRGLAFRPAATEPEDSCVRIDANSTLRIEDYSGCDDRSGAIRYELPDLYESEGNVQLSVGFQDYGEGTPGEPGYRGWNGETVWTLVQGHNGINIFSKEQVQLTYVRDTEEGPRTIRLQNNNLWVYTIRFETGELVVNTTSAFTDLDTYDTYVLDFQEISFDTRPDVGCPRGPVSGRTSLSGYGQSVTVTVLGCAEVQSVSAAGTRTLKLDEVEALFRPAVESFGELIRSLENSAAVGIVGSAGNDIPENCSFDSGSAPDPVMGALLGTWCSAWPAWGVDSADWTKPAWLDCRIMCVADGMPFYGRTGGIATNLTGPDSIYETAPYFIDPMYNSIPSSFTPSCRDPFIWETGTWYARTITDSPTGNMSAALVDFSANSPDGSSMMESWMLEPYGGYLDAWWPDMSMPGTYYFDRPMRAIADPAGLRVCEDADWQTMQ